MKFNVAALLVLIAFSTKAQEYRAEKGDVSFFSDATLEDIKANNTKATSIFDGASGNVAFVIYSKDFQFDKALMQEHFNEKYMETEKYPKSTFQGKIIGYDPAATKQQVKAKGKMTIHGVTQEVEIPGTIEKEGDRLVMKSVFPVRLENYKITIPKLLWENIAEQIEVTVKFIYKRK